jgi:hypothetical protein
MLNISEVIKVQLRENTSTLKIMLSTKNNPKAVLALLVSCTMLFMCGFKSASFRTICQNIWFLYSDDIKCRCFPVPKMLGFQG